MNTVTLDSMAFDNFEVIDDTLLSNIEAGNITWNGFVGATAEGAWTGAVGGGIAGAVGGDVVLPILGTVPGYVGGAILGGIGGAVANGSWYLITGGD
ncbi:hypothetical protein [Streptococcus mutans]|uniref:hypothetical protein n=1 Tax=Streptococcus mutans TaxID=1309 RepID=UPI0038B72AF6